MVTLVNSQHRIRKESANSRNCGRKMSHLSHYLINYVDITVLF